MNRMKIAIAGAAETDLGALPHMSELDLRADAAYRALADAGLTIADVDGITSATESPIDVAHYLGITPSWYDGTSVGGCSFLVHVRHAAAAIRAGLCTTVLVLHGESGRSQVGRPPRVRPASSMLGQFELPYGAFAPPNMFTLPVMRYLKDTGTTHEQLAEVVVAQSHWAAGNPRASRNKLLTVQDVMASPLIAYPFHKLECCVVTDGGGALVITSADRARNLRNAKRPVYLLGSGEACDSPMVSLMDDMTSSKGFKRASKQAFEESGIKHADVDHLMIYDAFAHLPLYGLEDLGFVGRGEVPSSRLATPDRGESCRSTPTAAAFFTPIPACMACSPFSRRCVNSGAKPINRSMGSRPAWCRASAACSPRPRPWCCRIRSRDPES